MPDERRDAHEDDETVRASELLAAQDRALGLLDAIEAEGIVAPGVTDREAGRAIRELAARDFGVERHWHKRIVRSGPHTLLPYRNDPPDRTIGNDDIVFADLGPLFGQWEADVGRTWVMGDDPDKARLRDDLGAVFEHGRRTYLDNPGITGHDLHAAVIDEVHRRGWTFGNTHCGHVVGQFPHENLGDDIASHITPGNHQPLDRPDPSGRLTHWILEIHLIEPGGRWGGFHERLLTVPRAG